MIFHTICPSFIPHHLKSFSRNFYRHKKAVHEGVKYPSGQCSHQALSKDILLNINEQYMKVYNTHADKATIKLHPEDILLDIKGQYMKVSNTHAGNASIKQLQREGR